MAYSLTQMKSKSKRKIQLHCLYTKGSQYNAYSTTISMNNTNSFLKANLTQAPNSPKVLTPVKDLYKATTSKRWLLCEGGMNCPNYKALKEAEAALSKCHMVNIQLRRMNEVLQNCLSQKSRLFMNMINDSILTNNDNGVIEKNKATINSEVNNNRSLPQGNDMKTISSVPEAKVEQLQRKGSKKRSMLLFNEARASKKEKTILFKEEDDNYQPSLQYDNIMTFSNRNLRFNANNVSISLLSINKDFNSIIRDNTSLTMMSQLVSSEQTYLEAINAAKTQTLLSYYDAMNFLVKDYKELIKLNLRMKDFIKCSGHLVESVLNNTSTTVLINNACSILDCDRATLFIYDKVTDMLVVHSGEGLRKCQIKIPKDAGIAGSVFMSGKKLRIDDAYLDSRFNKDVDKRTNYRTRNILCYPLRDRDGVSFGCIQAINKNERPFDLEDEELLGYFSQQASAILVNVINSTESLNQFNWLRAVIDYCIEIAKIKTIEDFSIKTEEMLMKVFNCLSSQLLFNFNQTLYHYKPNERKKLSQNIGLINIARERKKTIGCRDVRSSTIHNILVDLDTSEGLLTFPIVIHDSICAIAQVPSLSKINDKDQPSSSELSIVQLVSKVIVEWCCLNIELFA